MLGSIGFEGCSPLHLASSADMIKSSGPFHLLTNFVVICLWPYASVGIPSSNRNLLLSTHRVLVSWSKENRSDMIRLRCSSCVDCEYLTISIKSTNIRVSCMVSNRVRCSDERVEYCVVRGVE